MDFSNMRICAVKTADVSSRCVERFSMICDSDSDECMAHDVSSPLEDIYCLYSDETDGTTVCNIDGFFECFA